MFWISWANLGIPIRAQLSAVVFEKSMRRKNVKTANKSEKKVKSGESADASKDNAANGQNGPTETTPLIDTKLGADKIKDKKKDNKEEEEEDSGDDPTGQKSRQAVINLIGVDAKRVSDFAMFQFLFPNCAAKLIVAVWFLIVIIGWIPLGVGFLTWVIIIPINTHFAKKYSAAQDRLMKVRDQKLAIVNESLQGIRQIKFSALEPQWEKKILAMREKELKACWDVFLGDTVLFGCWITSPIALSAASLAVYAWVNGELKPSVAFGKYKDTSFSRVSI
jgi:hypothetical protein